MSDVPARIRYVLSIFQSGNDGDSTMSEIGDVDVLPFIPVEFGHTCLPLADVQLDAHLVVTWENGKIECGLVQAPNE